MKKIVKKTKTKMHEGPDGESHRIFLAERWTLKVSQQSSPNRSVGSTHVASFERADSSKTTRHKRHLRRI